MGKLPPGTKVSSDNGYFTGENIRYLEERKLDGYMHNKKQASLMKGKKKDEPYSKDKFHYDPFKDEFTCPTGKVLTRKGEYALKKSGEKTYAYYGANCQKCPVQLECAKSEKRKRVITCNEYEPELQRMARKIETKPGNMEHAKRKHFMEYSFGNIKYNMKYTEFLMQGINKNRVEQDLLNISHNLKRIWSKIEERIGQITGSFQKHKPKIPTTSVSA